MSNDVNFLKRILQKLLHFESRLNMGQRTAAVFPKYPTVTSYIGQMLHSTMHRSGHPNSKSQNDGLKTYENAMKSLLAFSYIFS